MTLQEWHNKHPDVTIHGGDESVLTSVRRVFSKDPALQHLEDFAICGDPHSKYLMGRSEYTLVVKRRPESAIPPQLTDDEVRVYLLNLKDGESVIETSMIAMFGRTGVVYHNAAGHVCVLWNKQDNETRQMGTIAAWGTRRLKDA